MKALTLIVSIFLVSSAYAGDCVTNLRGKTVCGNGETAVAVNPNTGNAAAAKTNQNGVTTTETSRGGEAKTKNGMGVAEGPNGTVCAKGRNKQGRTK